MAAEAGRERAQRGQSEMSERAMPEPVLSPRLQELLAEVVRGRAPNAGRFCGYCYHPLPDGTTACPHCQHATADYPPVNSVPREVLLLFLAQRRREATVVRSIAYGGLLGGLALALYLFVVVPEWWNAAVFMLTLGVTYVGAANLANSIGDWLGYNWGQSVARRRWLAFVAQRDGGRAS